MKLTSDMTGAQLQAALENIYGERWRIESPGALGMEVSTLDRQVRMETVPASTEATVKALAEVKYHRELAAARQRSYRKRKAMSDG